MEGAAFFARYTLTRHGAMRIFSLSEYFPRKVYNQMTIPTFQLTHLVLQ